VDGGINPYGPCSTSATGWARGAARRCRRHCRWRTDAESAELHELSPGAGQMHRQLIGAVAALVTDEQHHAVLVHHDPAVSAAEARRSVDDHWRRAASGPQPETVVNCVIGGVAEGNGGAAPRGRTSGLFCGEGRLLITSLVLNYRNVPLRGFWRSPDRSLALAVVVIENEPHEAE
jgi:hypothetical protein